MKQCKHEGCTRHVRANGMCGPHYRLWYLSQTEPCSIPGCDAPRWARKLCTAHYQRWWEYGNPVEPNHQRVEVPTYGGAHGRARKTKSGNCSTPGCTNTPTEMALIKGRGRFVDKQGARYSDRPEDYQELCRSCHMRYDGLAANLGVKPGIKQCSVPGCQRAHLARSYCGLHYKRWKATGDPLKVKKLSRPDYGYDAIVA